MLMEPPVEALYENLTVYMMIGVGVVVGLSQFNRMAGAVLALPFWVSVAVLGVQAINAGRHLRLGSIPVGKGALLVLCGVMIAMNLAMAYAAHKRKQRGRRPVDDDYAHGG